MSLSRTLVEHLTEKQAEFKAVELPEPLSMEQLANFLGNDKENLLRTVVLYDDDKAYIALLPWADLLDYRRICEHLGKELSVATPENARNYFRIKNGNCCAPLPDLCEAAFIVDPSVLDREAVLVESGDPKTVLLFEKVAINLLWADATVIPFAANSDQIYAGRNADANEDELEVSFTPIRIKQRIDDTFDLPAMPDIAQDIMKLRVDPRADATRLGDIVSRDPSLAAQVISWASSPYYGYQGTVDSVETAIARVLGFELVMNLALGISIGKSLRVPADGPLGVRAFWRQAIYSANLCEKLWRLMPVKQRPERGLIYLGGLLHNFGHLLLGHIFPPQFHLVNQTLLANPHYPVEDIEFYILGVTHEEIGGWLMQNWHMPDELIVAVLRHHQEEFWSKHGVYSNIVLVANRLLKRLEIGDSLQTEIPQSTLDLLGIDRESIESALESVHQDSDTLDAMAKQLVA